MFRCTRFEDWERAMALTLAGARRARLGGREAPCQTHDESMI
jgi:hypothetical protein